MKPSVYLADLRYNYTGFLANDCMPLGVAYLKAVIDRDLPEVTSRLFAYPDRLWDAMQATPPSVLMLSNYLWNEQLSMHFAKLARRLNPEVLVVMGGPNIPIESERQIQYFQSHPEVDVYIQGEADFLAAEILKHYVDAGLSRRELGSRELPSSLYRRPDGTPVLTATWDRRRDVDDIPSPWLTGIQDEFFDGKLAPMVETNRGCPFTCTFCVQGTSWYTRVNHFGLDRMKEEILYVTKKIKQLSPHMGTLRIADSNFGMFERDVEISEYIGQMQRDYGYPTFIDATTGKNRPDRIIRSVEKVSGALVVYQAVQSLNDDVLRNIKRSNIKLKAYEEIMVHVRGRGLRSNSDLIVGLPGETLDTHLAAIQQLIDAGTNSMHNLQLVLLKGSELEEVKTRSEFQFVTRWRVLPKMFGIYGGDQVLDAEEVVVGTDTFSFDDYVTTRKIHLVSSVFWNNSWFDDAVQVVKKFGYRPSEWFMAMLPALEASTGPAREFLTNFASEATGELFPTFEACQEFYQRPENFARMLAGDIGDNLMYKYRARASFQIWPEVCAVAMKATRDLIESRLSGSLPEDFDQFWADFHRYVEAKHASGMTEETILGPVDVEFRYDIPAWVADEMPLEIGRYRLAQPERFQFELTPAGVSELQAALRVWTTSIKGMTRLVTRIRSSSQIRTATRVGAEVPLAMSASA